jgi:hypothetical protein
LGVDDDDDAAQLLVNLPWLGVALGRADDGEAARVALGRERERTRQGEGESGEEEARGARGLDFIPHGERRGAVSSEEKGGRGAARGVGDSPLTR